MIKTVLFDADGVLFFHADNLFSDRIIAEYGADRQSVEVFFTSIFPYAVRGQKDLREELASIMTAWHWPGSVDELMEYWYSYEHSVDQPLLDYVKRLRLNGIPSYVATNNDHYRAQWLFRHLNLDETVFSGLYAAGDMQVAKPDTAFFQYIADDLQIQNFDEVLFWDDSAGHVEAAGKFGFNAELYTTFTEFERTMEAYNG